MSRTQVFVIAGYLVSAILGILFGLLAAKL